MSARRNTASSPAHRLSWARVAYVAFVAAAAVLGLGLFGVPRALPSGLLAASLRIAARMPPSDSAVQIGDAALQRAFRQAYSTDATDAQLDELRSRLRIDPRAASPALQPRVVLHLQTSDPRDTQLLDHLAHELVARYNVNAAAAARRMQEEPLWSQWAVADGEVAQLRRSLDQLVAERDAQVAAAAQPNASYAEPMRMLNPLWIKKAQEVDAVKRELAVYGPVLTQTHPRYRNKLSELENLEHQLAKLPRMLDIEMGPGGLQLAKTQRLPPTDTVPVAMRSAADATFTRRYQELAAQRDAAQARRVALEMQLRKLAQQTDKVRRVAWLERQAHPVWGGQPISTRDLLLLVAAGLAGIVFAGACVAVESSDADAANAPGLGGMLYYVVLAAAQMLLAGFLVGHLVLAFYGQFAWH